MFGGMGDALESLVAAMDSPDRVSAARNGLRIAERTAVRDGGGTLCLGDGYSTSADFHLDADGYLDLDALAYLDF